MTKLFIITAPSGAGKTTVMNYLKAYQQRLVECISHTTRKMRNGEIEGRSYYFIDEEKFDKAKEAGEFAESVEYRGNKYGMSKFEIEDKMEDYRYVYIIAEFEGYKQLKKLYPDAVGIFLHMSKEDCIANMLLRGDTLADALHRADSYEEEMKNSIAFPYVVKNVRSKIDWTAKIIENIIYQNS